MSFKAIEDGSWEKESAVSYWLLPVSGAPASKGTFLPLSWMISIQVQQVYVPRYWEAIAVQLDDIQTDSERTLYEFQRGLDHVCTDCMKNAVGVTTFTCFHDVYIEVLCCHSVVS